MPVFHNDNGKLRQLNVLPLSKEKLLQRLIEENLFEIFEMDFLATEYVTTANGRIDTIAIDTNGAPVIIEYKRNKHDNVIIQALSYLSWLKSQKVGFFRDLVSEKLSHERADKIDWKNPRVVCVAESYNPYDIIALNEISNLELYRYHLYENDIFTLENVKGEDERPQYREQSVVPRQIVTTIIDKESKEISLETHLNRGQPFVRELFFKLQKKIFELDENIQEKVTNPYVGYRVSKMFTEVHIQKSKLLIYLRPKIDYDDIERRLSKVPDSFNWVLNHRVYITSESDIDYVMNLIEQSYKDVL